MYFDKRDQDVFGCAAGPPATRRHTWWVRLVDFERTHRHPVTGSKSRENTQAACSVLPTSCALNVPASASARPCSSLIKPTPCSRLIVAYAHKGCTRKESRTNDALPEIRHAPEGLCSIELQPGANLPAHCGVAALCGGVCLGRTVTFVRRCNNQCCKYQGTHV